MNNRIPLHLWTVEAHFSSIFKIRCIRPSATLVTHRALVRQLVRIGSQGSRGRWPGCRRKVSLLVKAGVPRSRLWESGIPKDRMCHESDLSLLVNDGWAPFSASSSHHVISLVMLGDRNDVQGAETSAVASLHRPKRNAASTARVEN
jgi:hypothetical protein